MSENPLVSVEVLHGGQVWLVRIERSEVRNCVNRETAKALFRWFRDFDRDPVAKCAVFASSEGVFCAGYDLSEVSKTSSDDLLADVRNFEGVEKGVEGAPKGSSLKGATGDGGDGETGGGDGQKKSHGLHVLGPMGPSRMMLTKPVIAAVEGFAVAGGLELCCWCDLVVSHSSCSFGVLCRRFGVPLIDGGTTRLAKIVGRNRALEMILLGRSYSGQTMHEWGLVNFLVPSPDEVLSKAIETAVEMCSLPQICLRSDLRSHKLFGFAPEDFAMSSLRGEFELGMAAVRAGETAEGASRFSKGRVGRHGSSLTLSKEGVSWSGHRGGGVLYPGRGKL
uniref:Uncharacterized protein n=1 Tax=Chromera velia CCMP2878 TaxID=1169474 RepID=A0A0G4HTN3_9ALVE|eukprot:Cvel_1340.t1-p1 / transcript=Cvel_1340.t1 / gene=Cvel_1340 / organism=Chromera_velia_CCMP2878 / gene_product=Probable enoyl-CoA hydratase, putative / transcript_product=Probable enoyl-CoA hydratase, putative / location=Cvel_scaffold46:22138-23142(-) / protein_length=335 / sequence_SO=supercontig / SO=protein_coding / is_pseudo=false